MWDATGRRSANGRAGSSDQRCKIIHVDGEGPFQPVRVGPSYKWFLLVVHGRRGVLGHIMRPVPANRVVSESDQRAVVATQLGGRIWRDRMLAALESRAREEPTVGPQPTVAVVICTRDRPRQLRDCLDALVQLRTRPNEILVVDNAPSDETTAAVCSCFPVRYLREELPGQARARNRGIVETTAELIAFTDDDCLPDPRWLDDLASSFTDPLVMTVTGYVGPAELEHPAQLAFEAHYGFGRTAEPRVIDPSAIGAVRGAALAGAGANMIFRRDAFSKIGFFPEEFGPGTPARSGDDKYYFYKTLSAGFRISQEPQRKVWHRHRATFDALRRIMNDYGTSEFALAARCLVMHRELSALRIFQWWLRHFLRDITGLLRHDPLLPPGQLVLAEIAGAAAGPWRLHRSSRSRRAVPPIGFPAARQSGDWNRATSASITVAELPPLSVALPTHNRRAELHHVLDALARQEYPRHLFEVVLVVDGSTDGTTEMARALQVPYALRVVEQDNGGTASARNHAVRATRFPIIVSLDDDIRPVPGFLLAHGIAHRDGDRRRVVLGYCPPANAQGMWGMILRAWWEDHYRLKAQAGHQWTFIDCADGNASMSRELFDSAGGYDEDFNGKNRHDWELGHRLLITGARFSFHPQAEASHHYLPIFRAAVANQRECGRLDVLLARKHPGLIGRLPLVNVARILEAKPSLLGSRYRASSRIVAATDVLLPVLRLYESFGLRRRWQALANEMLMRAYLLGVCDAVPEAAELIEFLRPIELRSEVTSLSISLDGRTDPLPADAGRVELAIGRAGTGLATVTAVEGAAHWDWDRVNQRIVDEAGETLRLQLALDGLEHLLADYDDGR